MNTSNPLHIGWISVAWVLAIFCTNPFGNFPLNDDWAYATDVKNLLATGNFAPLGWTSMSLYTHVLWGVLWSTIFGFSFEVLRFSSLLAALIFCLNTYAICRHLNAAPNTALLITLCLLFNPIFYALSFTFMTEVSFMMYLSFSVLFFVKYFKNPRYIWFGLAIIFSVIATLSRQTGLFLPLAFGCIFLLKNKPAVKTTFTALLPLFIVFFSLKYFEHQMFINGKTQALYGLQVDELKYLLTHSFSILPLRIVRNAYQASLYLGLLGIPIWVFFTLQSTRYTRYWGALCSLLFCGALLANQSQMPTLFGIITPMGIGPFTLLDTYILSDIYATQKHLFWQIVSLLSALGAGLMCGLIFAQISPKKLRKIYEQPLALFFIIAALIYFAPFVLVGFFDRYLLPLMLVVPLGILTLPTLKTAQIPKSNRYILPAILLIIMALSSILATKDYLVWNRTRWAAIEHLTTVEKVSTKYIDGGFEFGGWHNFHEKEVSLEAQKSWWWIEEAQYIITFHPVKNYKIIQKYPYQTWLCGPQEIIVSQKICEE